MNTSISILGGLDAGAGLMFLLDPQLGRRRRRDLRNRATSAVHGIDNFAKAAACGSTIANAGLIRFEPMPAGQTRVDLRMGYNPPAGALGHFAARLFEADARSAMDDDLVRFKSLIEESKTRAPGGKHATREELTGQPITV